MMSFRSDLKVLAGRWPIQWYRNGRIREKSI